MVWSTCQNGSVVYVNFAIAMCIIWDQMNMWSYTARICVWICTDTKTIVFDATKQEPVREHWARRWAWVLQLRVWLCRCCAPSVSLACTKPLIGAMVNMIILIHIVWRPDDFRRCNCTIMWWHRCYRFYVNVMTNDDERLVTWTCPRWQDQCKMSPVLPMWGPVKRSLGRLPLSKEIGPLLSIE